MIIDPPVFSVQPSTRQPTMDELLGRLKVGRFERESVVRTLLCNEQVFPEFNATWVPVQCGPDVFFYVTPDYLCVGSNSSFLHVRVNPITAEDILSRWDAVLPTRQMTKLIYEQSQKMAAQPMTPADGFKYDDTMMNTSRWPIHDAWIAKSFKAKGYKLGKLTAGSLKETVTGIGCVEQKAQTVGICGFMDANGREIQTPNVRPDGKQSDGQWKAHEYTYCDYSHGVRGVYKLMWLRNQWVSVADVCAGPEFGLISQYRFSPYTYHDIRFASGQ